MINHQIYTDRFAALSDYIWDSHNDYYAQTMALQYDLKVVNKTEDFVTDEPRVILLGTCQEVKDCLRAIPQHGRFILITRDHDFPITEEIYALKPPSVKHWFAINCNVKHLDITAIPIGVNTIQGASMMLERVREEPRDWCDDHRIFSRFNVNKETGERHKAHDNANSEIQLIIKHQIGADEFYRHIANHQFTLSPSGNGPDCLRTWETLYLGRIPIVTDCPAMRHFDDMPIAYAPKNYQFTNEWLNEQEQNMKSKSLERSKFTYWQRVIYRLKSQL